MRVGMTRILLKVIRRLMIALVALQLLVVVVTALHAFAHVCPLHLRGFQGKQVTHVIYGLVFPGMLKPNQVWGGCVVWPLKGLCPYCGWPAVFGRG
jgi:hypothetical protein